MVVLFNLNSTLLPHQLNARTVTALALRARGFAAVELWRKYLSKYRGSDLAVLSFSLKQGLDWHHPGTTEWAPKLDVIARSYASSSAQIGHFFFATNRPTVQVSLQRALNELPSGLGISEYSSNNDRKHVPRPIANATNAGCCHSGPRVLVQMTTLRRVPNCLSSSFDALAN